MSGSNPIVCTLDDTEVPGRLAEWEQLAEHVIERTDTVDGIRVRFDDQVGAAEVADLAAKEQSCCSFFTFTLRIATDGVVLDIAAPEDARELVGEFFDQRRALAEQMSMPSSFAFIPR
jgi:hypothetical protein